jgi:hypothetical protein
MPASVENLLVEVKRVGLHCVAQWARRSRLASLVVWQRAAGFLHLERRLICLKDNIGEVVCIVYPEIIMVRAGKNMSAHTIISGRSYHASGCNVLVVTTPDTLEFIEDTVVLI